LPTLNGVFLAAVKVSAKARGEIFREPPTSVVLASIVSKKFTPVASAPPLVVYVDVIGDGLSRIGLAIEV
jgi:hypothetical protein